MRTVCKTLAWRRWSCWQPISRSSRARADCLRLRDSIPLPHFPLSPFSDRFSPLIGYRQVRTRTETPPRSRPHFENCWTDRLSSHWICALSPIFKPPVIWRNFSILGEKGPGNVGKCKIELLNSLIWRDICNKTLAFGVFFLKIADSSAFLSQILFQSS